MLELFKAIFTKNSKIIGDLKIDRETLKNMEIEHIKDNLIIKYPDNDVKIPINKIKSIKLKENDLIFVYNNKEYKFTSKNAAGLHEKILPLITSVLIFSSDKLTYYIYNVESKMFVPFNDKTTLSLYSNTESLAVNTEYYLKIETENDMVHFEEVNSNTQYYIDQTNNSFVWSVYSEEQFYTFCVNFKDKLDFLEFRTKYLECIYKSANKDIGKDQLNYEYYKKIGEYTDHESGENGDDNEENNDEYGHTKGADEYESKNKMLVMGDDCCYVTRGDSLGIFDLESNDLVFRTRVKKAVKDPIKILPKGSDSLVILDKNNRKELELMDLHKGEVIESWDVGYDMNDYFDSQRSKNDGTLVGLSDYSLFRIDPRMKDKIVEVKSYKTKNEFACGTATSRGDVAVVSKKGDLRLYNKIDKRAKTLIPGFGDEMIGVDTSKDGSLVVCTCKSYLLLYEVDGDYSKHSSSTARRLQLKPQHLSFVSGAISFTPAKFDEEGKYIVSSTGKYVVKWRVKDVLQGNIYSYSMKLFSENVVDEDFVIKGSDIVVAMENDLRKVREKDLKVPKYK